MSFQPPPRFSARTPSPQDSALMHAILNAAQQMFPGDPWEDVEPHLRRAWRTILDPTPWEDVRDWMHAAWLERNGDPPAANAGDGADTVTRLASPP